MSAAVFGRPCRLCWLPSYFLATNSRYHRRMVSGDATVATSASAFRPRRLPNMASFLRSGSVNLTLLGPSRSRRRRFSAFK